MLPEMLPESTEIYNRSTQNTNLRYFLSSRFPNDMAAERAKIEQAIARANASWANYQRENRSFNQLYGSALASVMHQANTTGSWDFDTQEPPCSNSIGVLGQAEPGYTHVGKGACRTARYKTPAHYRCRLRAFGLTSSCTGICIENSAQRGITYKSSSGDGPTQWCKEACNDRQQCAAYSVLVPTLEFDGYCAGFGTRLHKSDVPRGCDFVRGDGYGEVARSCRTDPNLNLVAIALCSPQEIHLPNSFRAASQSLGVSTALTNSNQPSCIRRTTHCPSAAVRKHCRGNMLGNETFDSRTHAKMACMKAGASCLGVYDQTCDGTGVLALCDARQLKSSTLQDANSSCVFLRPAGKRARRGVLDQHCWRAMLLVCLCVCACDF